MKKFSPYYFLLAVLVAVYTLLVINTPPNQNVLTNYSITTTQVRLLSLTFLVPYAVVWFIAFYGFIKVKEYALLIAKTRDGYAFKILSDGLMLLAISLPFGAVVSALRNYLISQEPSLRPTMTIITNYSSLVISLVALWLVSHGARKLVGTLDKKAFSITQTAFAVIFTAFSIFYTYITLVDPFRQEGNVIFGRAAYYLPDVLVFATIVVPYILLWLLGFRAAYHILLYRNNVQGVLYRNALGFLASGIAFSVLSLMVLRLLVSLTGFLEAASLRVLLIIIYALLIVIGAGYVLIAFGAKRLKKIEEV